MRRTTTTPLVKRSHGLPLAASAGAFLLMSAMPGRALLAEDKNHASPAVAGAKQASPSSRTSPALPPPEPGDELAELIKEGATMEEIARVRDPVAKSPRDAIRALKTGNSRFFGGGVRRPELSPNERRAQILSQSPFAVIVGCSDSRVPTELIYDQSLGSLFVIRVAGNIVESATAGSVEYAISHLKSHIVVVMGHEGCGAVAAAMLPKDQRDAEPENVRFILDKIRPAVATIPALRDKKARMREAVIANVRHQVHEMNQNPTVAKKVQAGQIQVIGAYYEIGSGAVDFLETDDELRLSTEDRAVVEDQVRQAEEKHQK